MQSYQGSRASFQLSRSNAPDADRMVVSRKASPVFGQVLLGYGRVVDPANGQTSQSQLSSKKEALKRSRRTGY